MRGSICDCFHMQAQHAYSYGMVAARGRSSEVEATLFQNNQLGKNVLPGQVWRRRMVMDLGPQLQLVEMASHRWTTWHMHSLPATHEYSVLKLAKLLPNKLSTVLHTRLPSSMRCRFSSERASRVGGQSCLKQSDSAAGSCPVRSEHVGIYVYLRQFHIT